MRQSEDQLSLVTSAIFLYLLFSCAWCRTQTYTFFFGVYIYIKWYYIICEFREVSPPVLGSMRRRHEEPIPCAWKSFSIFPVHVMLKWDIKLDPFNTIYLLMCISKAAWYWQGRIGGSVEPYCTFLGLTFVFLELSFSLYFLVCLENLAVAGSWLTTVCVLMDTIEYLIVCQL